jgi:hypothetical protein
MEPTHAHSVADFELRDFGHRGSNLGDDSNAFMSKTLLVVKVVLIGTANTAMRYLDDDLGRPWFTMTFCFDYFSTFGPFEDSEVDSHGYECIVDNKVGYEVQ